MTFMHKLARRLAVLRALPPHSAMIPALALIAACSAGVPTGVDTALNPADAPIVVNPRSLILEANQVSMFKAYARGVPGDSLVTSIEWTATGGTIALNGTYSSPSTGDFRVVGKRHGPTKTTSDTATVTVVPPQPSITSVVISPGSATVTTGTQQTFSATGKLSDGSTVAIGVTWTATGGNIDAGGVYTAGSTAGTYRVIAQAASANVADTVPLTVTAPAPPSSGGSAQYPNLPSGLSPLFQFDANGLPTSSMTSTNMTLGVGSYRTYYGSASIATPGDVPVDAPACMDVLYPAGLAAGGQGVIAADFWSTGGFPQVSRYYEADWFRMGPSAGQVDFEGAGGGDGGFKMLGYWGVGQTPGTSENQVYNFMTAATNDGFAPNGAVLGTTWTVGMRAQGGVSWAFGGGSVRVGHWYRIEYYMQLESSLGAGNGVLKVWLTDVTAGGSPQLIINATVPYLFSGGTSGFSQRTFVPIFGGTPSQPKYRNDHVQIARMAGWGQ